MNSARDVALDWAAIGRFVRQRAVEAVALHCDSLGDTDHAPARRSCQIIGTVDRLGSADVAVRLTPEQR